MSSTKPFRGTKPFICGIAFLAIAAGCQEIFVPALENKHVVLVAPGNGILSGDSIQTFFWQPLDTAISYEIQIVSPSFDNITQFVVDSDLISNQFQVVLPGDTYQWRVRAYNSSSTSQFTLPWNLTVQ